MARRNTISTCILFQHAKIWFIFRILRPRTVDLNGEIIYETLIGKHVCEEIKLSRKHTHRQLISVNAGRDFWLLGI